MNLLRPFLLSLLSLSLFFALDNRISPLPPLGKFLNPFAGFWQNNRSMDHLPERLDIAELRDEVNVLWDNRRVPTHSASGGEVLRHAGVPHIVAKNLHDLYIAQGYITARDRLWQMEFQALASAGRLSEFLGSTTLEYDRFRRRIGIVAAAEKAVEAALANDETRAMIEPYTIGVNAWIRQLETKKLPIEYKIFNYKPEEWTPIKTALLLKYFSFTLTFRSDEAAMTRTRDALGDKLMAELFPEFPPYMDPVIPTGTKWPKPVLPSPPKSKALSNSANDHESDESHAGSNNWAVSGKRTASGFPILANDPHLNLTLPSIWYEMQLIAPELNVYGVTSPGAPGILIGFNEQMGWGVTNANSDVLDWYRVEFKDASLRAYRFDNEWRPTKLRIEEIKVRGGGSVIDTVIWTHQGPLVYKEHEKSFDTRAIPGFVMRWAALDSSNELLAFNRLNRAANYDDFRKALEHLHCPAQNFVYAGRDGNIAIVHNGKFPVRQRDQGKYISDGSNPLHDWQRFVPMDQVPAILNPSRGFVSSANQNPTDPSYPYYLGSSYAAHERGARINEQLAQLDRATPEQMMELQNDVVNIHARRLLPAMLKLVDTTSFSALEREALRELASWNYEYRAYARQSASARRRADHIAPRVYDTWWSQLYDLIWRDDIVRDSIPLSWPGRDVTTWMILNNPRSPFIDNRTTENVETLVELVNESFKTTCRLLSERYGEWGRNWTWGATRGTNVNHLGRIPGLGRTKLPTGGNHNTVNAITATNGPSWRMVVEFGPQIRAWAIYPGGQSGNPGSPFYDNMMDEWVAGTARQIDFLTIESATTYSTDKRTILRPAR